MGHTPVRTQLTWCQKTGVPRAIFTHCGAAIVQAEDQRVQAELQDLAGKREVQAQIAYDGLEVVLR